MRHRWLILLFLLVWGLGFIDLATHTSVSERATLFGRYSPSFFTLLLLYATGFLVWGALFFLSPSRINQGIAYLQNRWWLVLATWGALGLAFWGLFNLGQFLTYPLLRFALFLLILLAGLTFIFTGWPGFRQARTWQKMAATLLVGVVALELLAQALAFLGLMPGIHKINGSNVHYGRVYYNEEGLGNGLANNYGWYYPDFRLEDSSRKILLMGDSFIQGLQVEPHQNLGVELEKLIRVNETATLETEVLGLGHPGFGPGLYLDLALLEYPIQALAPDEIIVFLHLGSDLRSSSRPAPDTIYFFVDEQGNAKVHPDSFNFWHNLAHYVIYGYDPFDPVRTLETYYLTPQLLAGMTHSGPQAQASTESRDALAIPSFRGYVSRWGPDAGPHTVVKETYLVAEPGAGNYIFNKQVSDEASEGLTITKSLIDLAASYAGARGITFRLVTIPAFPEAFYTSYEADSWSPELGDYDLFLPEKELQAFAAEEGIPFLAMGQWMAENRLVVEEIQRLYLSEGVGHFTPQGHATFAQAVYACFYAKASETASCLKGEE